jgi:hypothetical protein
MKSRKQGQDPARDRKKGSLVIVGTGLKAALHLTPEALAEIRAADRVFYLISDPLSETWIRNLRPSARSLTSCYVPGRPRMQAYERMVEKILAPVRSGQRVCAAFYGHPGVSVSPSHEAIRRARSEGFDAEMLPGISVEDSLFAELGLDPAASGCQSYEATDFLVYRRKFDRSSALLLWQVGVVGNLNYAERPARSGLRALSQRLARAYGKKHGVVLYEASLLPVIPSTVRWTTVEEIPTARITGGMTLFVPPLSHPPDPRTLRALGLRRSSRSREFVGPSTDA